MAQGDSRLVLLRKIKVKLRLVQRNISEARDDELMEAFLEFKDVLLTKLKAAGDELEINDRRLEE